MLGRAHSWIDRSPVAADAALAAALLALSLGAYPHAVAISVALTAPLALRRRAPVAVFAAVLAGCGAALVFADELLPASAAALVALYTLVAYAPRRLAALGFVVTLVGAVPFPGGWPALAAQLTVAAVLGDRRRARLREREREAELAAAAERARITREVHDIVAHSLSVVIAQADGGRYADPAGALARISSTAREALAEMRHALGALGEPPGAQAVGTLVERTRAAGLAVELAHEGRPRLLGPGADLAVYRVAQEALTNVLKHAGPGASARVTLRWEPEQVVVVVRDDGAGAGACDGAGRGLAGMRERVEPRGGTLTAGPHPDGGFEVRAAIPAGS